MHKTVVSIDLAGRAADVSSPSCRATNQRRHTYLPSHSLQTTPVIDLERPLHPVGLTAFVSLGSSFRGLGDCLNYAQRNTQVKRKRIL